MILNMRTKGLICPGTPTCQIPSVISKCHHFFPSTLITSPLLYRIIFIVDHYEDSCLYWQVQLRYWCVVIYVICIYIIRVHNLATTASHFELYAVLQKQMALLLWHLIPCIIWVIHGIAYMCLFVLWFKISVVTLWFIKMLSIAVLRISCSQYGDYKCHIWFWHECMADSGINMQ